VKHKNGDLLADSHNTFNRKNNYFSQLLNVNRFSNVRQIEIHTAESLVPDPSPSEFKITIENLKSYQSPGNDQIPAEVIQAGGEILGPEFHKRINFIWNKEELSDQLTESIIIRVHKKGDKTDYSNYRGITFSLTSYKILSIFYS
jgi:hypothetical protein